MAQITNVLSKFYKKTNVFINQELKILVPQDLAIPNFS